MQPCYLISVSERNRVRTDRFHSKVRKRVRLSLRCLLVRFWGYFGPDATPAANGSVAIDPERHLAAVN